MNEQNPRLLIADIRLMRLAWALLAATLSVIALSGCSTTAREEKDEFFTSGSNEADQRAQQRMAKAEQLSPQGKDKGQGGASQVEQRQTLYERLGGEQGLAAIVEDYIPRVLQDPRVNWTRKGVERGGLLNRESGPVWQSNPQTLARLKKHMQQFLALATGGPAKYEGRQMVNVHQGMKITNPEFDAAVGDLKATLDHFKIADGEQKELLSIVESTRPQIVTER
jgi:hemoglobin